MPLDAADLAQLYDRHAGAVLAFLARRTFDPEAAVDLLGETFAAAFAARARFRGDTDEEAQAWLFGIARHRLLDFYRHGQVERRALARLGVERRELTDGEYDRIEELAASGPLRRAVDESLARLDATDRDLLRLRVVEERSYREVAGVLGMSEQAARARVSRALRGLRASPALRELMEATHRA